MRPARGMATRRHGVAVGRMPHPLAGPHDDGRWAQPGAHLAAMRLPHGAGRSANHGRRQGPGPDPPGRSDVGRLGVLALSACGGCVWTILVPPAHQNLGVVFWVKHKAR